MAHSLMEVMPPPLPPSKSGWLGGGMVLWPLETVVAGVALPEDPSLGRAGVLLLTFTSFCSCDAWFGEFDFLLSASAFVFAPPREELRGDTRPTCRQLISQSKIE